MPNRIIKESICTSDTLDQLTVEEERFFYRLLVQADDFGRFDGRGPVVLAGCFPLRAHEISIDQVEGWLQALADVDLIRFYYVDGRRYLQFTTWDRHQQKRAKHSKYPDPPVDDGHTISDDIKREASDCKCPRESRIREYENTRQTDETRAPAREEQSPPPDPQPPSDPVGPSVGLSDDSGFSAVAQAYHKAVGMMGPTQYDKLRFWHEQGMLPGVIERAISIAVEQQGKRVRASYIDGILRNWHNDGVRRPEDLQPQHLDRPGARPRAPDNTEEIVAQLKAEEEAERRGRVV